MHRSIDAFETHSLKRTSLVPIRVEFETETHRIRDCFVWNLYETLIKPETFAKIFCTDLDLPIVWAETVANQIRAQLEEHEGVASLDLGIDDYVHRHTDKDGEGVEEIPECRVILSVSYYAFHPSSFIVFALRLTLIERVYNVRITDSAHSVDHAHRLTYR